jgi:hypothetical protein
LDSKRTITSTNILINVYYCCKNHNYDEDLNVSELVNVPPATKLAVNVI